MYGQTEATARMSYLPYKDALENYKISLQLSEPNSYIFFRISKNNVSDAKVRK